MSEIEKMYENAGVLKECLSPCYINKTWRKTHDCPNCDNRENYPPFTAEKQIELIKLLKDSRDFYICGKNYSSNDRNGDTIEYNSEVFSEGLAGLINTLWQDLTEEEKQQLKGILE